ncbi:BlaI/MecI/CopY family transcriptional regulator [Streptomyces platensis]|uniref:BlaI/MecI/CopY family transcriptional regulator n=1 Tax=Streptomyces platensis TaxID=58346 RepID=UPI003C2DBEDF
MAETSPVRRRPPGELEASVLAALWAAEGPLSAAAVQSALGGRLARTTVTTILTRLHDKGAVSRSRAGRGFVYAPIQDSAGLTARRMRNELDKQHDRGAALARFVSQLTSEDEELLRKLLGGAGGGAAGGPQPGAGDGPGL